MFNRIVKIATVSGLAAITALTSLGMGSVNVLADDIKLPAYVINGTNAERAISDYFVNNFTPIKENSVVIPHMDIISTDDNGSTLDVYGGFCIQEYTKDNVSLVEDGAYERSTGHFTLNKNQDGTFTIASYREIPDDASKENFNEIFGKSLSDEAFDVYGESLYSDLWNTIRSQDIAYYSFDNNLGLSKIGVDESHSIDLANVSFSKDSASKKYAQQDANVRSAATTLGTAFDGIGRGDDITVTGLANGWYRVAMDGRTGFISASLLDDSKPAKEKKEEKKDVNDGENKIMTATGILENMNSHDVTVGGVTAAITSSTDIQGSFKDGDSAKLYFYSGEHGINYALAIIPVSSNAASTDDSSLEEIELEDNNNSDSEYELVEIPEDNTQNEISTDAGEEYFEVELED